jgi:alkaline phosphatase
MNKVIVFLVIFSSVYSLTIKAKSQKIKNIIFVIGDGMGPQQLSLLNKFAIASKYSKYKNGKSNLQKMMDLGETGLVFTEPKNQLVTDSSCSATQYATGQYSIPLTVGLNEKGKKVQTIVEAAIKKGLSTGLVSDTRITHATPASYAAHNISRNNENELAEEMLSTGVDIMLSGGARHFLPKSHKDSRRKDDKNLLKLAKEMKYHLPKNKSELRSIKSGKILGLFNKTGLSDAISFDPNGTEPSLVDMSKKAIDILSKNKKGFFLMIEAGQIDWTGHRNDAGGQLHEMLRIDSLVGYLIKWQKENKDTLVIVTADHETGSFGMSYSTYKSEKGKYNFGNSSILDKLYEQKMTLESLSSVIRKSDRKVETIRKIINDNMSFQISKEDAEIIAENTRYGLDEFYPFKKKGFSMSIAKVLGKYQNIVWGTGTHTSTPVPIIALGPKKITDQFDGAHHSTEIGKMTFKVLGLD